VQQPVLVIIENDFYEYGALKYAQELKTISPSIKLIMLSAQDELIRQEASRAGIDVFLIKPFTKSQLLNSVITLLSTKEKF
jgi:DNA-binding response OmpR family regulator